MPKSSLRPRGQLVPLQDDGADTVQIFVHGYEGIQNAGDLQRWATRIALTRPLGACYLLCWGGWLELPEQPSLLQRLAESARTVARDTLAGRTQAWVDGVETAAWETLRFWSHAELAEQVGRRLPDLLSDTTRRGRLHLWGHSLGARLLLTALSGPQWNRPDLQHVVLMGAAADAGAALWQRAACRVGGRLANVFSPADVVLRLAPLWTPLAGLRTIECDAVTNVEMPFAHDDYWPRLQATVDRLQEAGVQETHAAP